MFYDMDLPEVIALRRELIPEEPGNPYIAASLLETEWMDDLRRRHPDGAFIFVVEGVLMYFYEKQVRSFLHHVASRFGGGEIWFDVCGTMMSKHGVKPDSLRKHEAQIRSGLSKRAPGGAMGTRPAPAGQANYMKFFRGAGASSSGKSWDGYPGFATGSVRCWGMRYAKNDLNPSTLR